MDALARWVLDQGPRKLLKKAGFKRPGGRGPFVRDRGPMADAVWLTGLEVYTRTTYDWPRVVEVSVQQRWSGLKFVERTYPLMVLDPRTGDREDFAIGLFSLLNSEVLPGLFVDVDETTIEACARDFEAREMPEHAAACWGWLGNEQEFSRVERWLRTGGEPVVG